MITNRREYYKANINPNYLQFYEALCNLLDQCWQPYSGYRSPSDQDKLYEEGRTAPGGIVTNAKGGQSAHNYGCATDWTIFENGQPVWPHKDDKRWEEYQTAVWKAGLTWGGDFGDVDHNELKLHTSYKSIGDVFLSKGMDVALEAISNNVVK